MRCVNKRLCFSSGSLVAFNIVKWPPKSSFKIIRSKKDVSGMQHYLLIAKIIVDRRINQLGNEIRRKMEGVYRRRVSIQEIYVHRL